MAEIPIERKPRRPVTPLLLVLIVILLIVAGWYWWTNKNKTAGTTTTSITPAVQLASISHPTVNGLNFRRA
jgi:TRAP-type C4-dicarboxylate transport system permease small subunit